MTLSQASLPPSPGQLPDPKNISDNTTERINEKQIIELFEWEGRSPQLATEFYRHHEQQLVAGTLTLPDVAVMIASLPELELKGEVAADTEETGKDNSRPETEGSQERKQDIAPKTSQESPANYSYKKRLYLDIEALREQNLDLNLDEYIILTWAYDFAQGGGNKSLKENRQEYFWFKTKKCRQDLPFLKIKTDRGVRFKFMKLIQKGLLIPHPNRKGIGSYYAFSGITKKLFRNHHTLTGANCKKYLEKIIHVLGEIRRDGRTLPTEIDEFYRHIEEKLKDGRTLPANMDEFIQVAWMISSYYNMVNNNIVNDNKQTLSKENFEFLEKLKIRNSDLEREKKKEREIFEQRIQELEKENESLQRQIRELEAKTETPSSLVPKQIVFEIFKNTGCAARAEIFYKENEELIKSGYMSKATIERKAREMVAMLQKEAQKKPEQQSPAKEVAKPTSKTKATTSDIATNAQNQVHQLALQTFEVFGISPSKTDLNALKKKIQRIQQERNLSLTVMQKNLNAYDAYVDTQGVTTQYSLGGWLSGDGSGYGKNWEKWLQKAQKNLSGSLSKEAADKAGQMAGVDYSSYKTSERPGFYPDIKPKTILNT